MFTLLILVIVGAIAIYAGITLWPERIPKERTVDAIRQRIEREDQ